MMTKSSQGGHSARVTMRRRVGERSVPVAQLDQSESRWRVYLPNGISAATKRVAITAAAQVGGGTAGRQRRS